MAQKDKSESGECASCSVCGSGAENDTSADKFQTEHAGWYSSRLEWALETPIQLENICKDCDQLLRNADRLESELSSTLATLQERHNSLLQQLAAGSVPADAAHPGNCQKQSGASSNQLQASGQILGPRDVLISIWTDQPSQAPTSKVKQPIPASASKGSHKTPGHVDAEAQTLESPTTGVEDGTFQHSTKKEKRKVSRNSCDGCQRPFCRGSVRARHNRRAQRGSGDVGSCTAPVGGRDRRSTRRPGRDLVSGESRQAAADTGAEKRSTAGLMWKEDAQSVTKIGHAGVSSVVTETCEERNRLQPEDLGLVPCASVAKTSSHDGEAEYFEYHCTPADGEKSQKKMAEDISAEPSLSDAEQLVVNRDQSWFQPDSVVIRESETRTLNQETHLGSHSPTPATVLSESTATADELALTRAHSQLVPEIIGDRESCLEHVIFPSLTSETSSAAGAEVAEPSVTSCMNEGLDFAPDSQELTIAFDVGLELPESSATSVEATLDSTSDTNVDQKTSAASVETSFHSASLVGMPPKLRRKRKLRELQTENSSETESSPTKMENSATGVRRPRLTLYERHGQKWRCLQCSAIFSSRTGAHGHALTHSEPDGGRCGRCGKSYANAYALRRHRAGCLSGRPPACHLCGKVVADSAYLAQHVLTHAADAPKRHQCERCGLAFAVGARLRAHMAAQHSEGAPHRCDICGREFALAAQLRRHRRSAHAAAPAVTCQVCGRGFSRADNLRAHMTVHTGARPHVCAQCGRAFTRADTLADHTRTHTGEKPYACAECGQTFREHRGYKRHLRMKHEQGMGDKAASKAKT